MNIIQMNLDDFGIYHNVSWNPPERGLIVMHGHNESGKTTLMKYVRSMFFGYLRGDWKGYFGHMDIRREDGHEYRIYRKEKDSYILDGDTTLHDEPSDLWWHGLDRQTYDKIFAMGLEDLQGFKILSNEEVRSHFFSIEGGVRMGMTRHELARQMGELLVASPQGKKPVNALMNEQKEFDQRIRSMAYDEDEFADLQSKEQTTHEIENRIRLSIEETKQQIENISMPIAAWDVYRRGQEAMNHMQELADVSQFPADGAQKWTELDNKIKEIDSQIKKLEATSRKGPAFKEEWNRWIFCGEEIDALYQHLTEWKQGLDELAVHEDKEMDWQFEENKDAQALKDWTNGPVPNAVDWSRGLALASDLARYDQEIEKWQAARPKNVSAMSEDTAAEPEKTEKDWETMGKAVTDIQSAVLERQKVQEQLTWLKEEPAGASHGFTFLGILFLLGGALLISAVIFYDVDVVLGGGTAVACLIAAVLAFVKQRSGSDRIPRKIVEVESQLAAIQEDMTCLAEKADISLSVEESNETWTQKLDEIRKGYLDWKTNETKNAWQKEQKVMYDAIYDTWQKNGKNWKSKLENSQQAWETWRSQSGFAGLGREQAGQAKELWDKWKAVATTAQQWQQRKKEWQTKISRWHDNAEQIFREVGLKKEAAPATVEAVYKQWQEIRVQAEVAKEQDKQQKERAAQLVQLRKDKDIRSHEQEDLLSLTGAQTVGEFRSKVLKFRQFHQYKEVFDQSEAHIRLIAKNPKNLAALRHELKIHTLKNWTDEKNYYERKIADSEKKLAEVAEKRGSIIERLSQMAKSEEYGQLLQDKENRKAELDSQVNEWLTCLYAQYMLGEAQAYYERVRQPLVIRQAGDYLHLMTQGRYTLQASIDGRQLYAVDGTQRRIPEKQWSSGLGDQIYLAIRISLAMAFSKQIEAMPIILDDILVRFDEQRQKQAIRFLADLGKKEQIFLFTCSRQTRDIAAEVQQALSGETDTIHLFEIEQGQISG
ncbi:MAG: AAA family ATPase [Megasphaera sp.]|jgi:uncharacterized protein YhaN|nr:AAA family ATPase [Megasphaera sp.]MCH4188309.1 AAA family ATPase [Megasphaera sp.]MCH4218347.1 AAA family ATPase [Megasphaera sp.]